MKNSIAGALVAVCLCYLGYRFIGAPPRESPSMPTPSAPLGPAAPTEPGKPSDVVAAKRVEIVDGAGVVQCVLTSEKGKPVAIVNDGGKALTIDLGRVARLAR